jgi:hypothetical protein
MLKELIEPVTAGCRDGKHISFNVFSIARLYVMIPALFLIRKWLKITVLQPKQRLATKAPRYGANI